MTQKKLLLLGGLRYLLPVIKVAHELGCYVITCDYIPDNIAHKYSDEYHNVSITDREAILKLARELQIDGIMSFAVDPGVVTAAYVAEKMNLPKAASLYAVEILQNKDLFRSFLAKHNFNVPKSGGYLDLEEAQKDIVNFVFPLIVKPTDSAGSKGVQRIDTLKELNNAFVYAKKHSISKRVIIEEFIEKKGETTGSDSFVVNGKLDCFAVDDQIFDNNALNPYTPIGHRWPSSMPIKHQNYLKSELQRLINILDIDTSILNIEARVGTDGKVYIMEVAPRGGGNRLSEILELATGAKLIENSVKAAIGIELDYLPQPTFHGIWHSEILFAKKEGVFEEVKIGTFAEQYIADCSIYVKRGDIVYGCSGANQTIGNIVFHFNSEKEYKKEYNHVKQDIIIKLR